MSAEERITEEAVASVRRKLAEREANWVASRLGLASYEFPEIMRRGLKVPLKPEFDLIFLELTEMKKRLDAIDKQIQAINDRLNKAGQLVKAIDERTRPKAAQPRR